MTADVFISYSREDKDRVVALAQKLREAGVSLWIDQGGIDGAAMWSEEIVHALEDAKVLMLMVSEKAVASHNVVKEVTIASERKGHILPVHLEPTRIPAALKYALAGIQHIEYFTSGPEEGTRSILRSLERLGVKVQPLNSTIAGAAAQTSSHLSSNAGMHSSVELERAIAVLPFTNISPDKETDYFSDGLTEELITNLSRLKDIRVVPGTITMQFKGAQKNIRGIGEELRARYVITGSVRKHAENLRVTAQLIDVQTEAQMWAETYKGKLEDVFEIQEQVAKQIVDALAIKLTMAQQIALTKRSTDNPEALDYYLRGREYSFKTARKNFEFAIQLYRKAIELDTRYANAYSGLGEAYAALFYAFERNPDYLERAAEASLKALMYDPGSAEAYAALGLTYFYQGNPREAEEACLKSVELNPQLFMGYSNLGRIYHLTDRDAKAVEAWQRAAELRPDAYAVLAMLAGILASLGRQSEREEVLRNMLDVLPRHLLREPEDYSARVFYALALSWVDRAEEARAEARRVLDAEPSDPLLLYNVACSLSQLRDYDGAVLGLSSAIKAGYTTFDWVKRDSDLEPIRNHPGYIELMKDK